MLTAQRLNAEGNTFIIPDVTKTDLIMLYHRASLDSKIVFNICHDNFERARDGRSGNRFSFVRILFSEPQLSMKRVFFSVIFKCPQTFTTSFRET